MSSNEQSTDIIGEQRQRIKALEKAVRILASEPHESVVHSVYAEIFPEEIAAQEQACKKLSQS
jgi:hypothetical protein